MKFFLSNFCVLFIALTLFPTADSGQYLNALEGSPDIYELAASFENVSSDTDENEYPDFDFFLQSAPVKTALRQYQLHQNAVLCNIRLFSVILPIRGSPLAHS